MSDVASYALPSSIPREALISLLDDVRNREAVLQAMIRRFEQQYGDSLEALETRLARGEGREHPDWRMAQRGRGSAAHPGHAETKRMATEFHRAVARFIARCNCLATPALLAG
jgi:hypothetical protein